MLLTGGHYRYDRTAGYFECCGCNFVYAAYRCFFLPFVSYGGNSLWIFMGCAGIVLNVSKQSGGRRTEKKEKRQ